MSPCGLLSEYKGLEWMCYILWAEKFLHNVFLCFIQQSDTSHIYLCICIQVRHTEVAIRIQSNLFVLNSSATLPAVSLSL